jgi:hypothetical protein
VALAPVFAQPLLLLLKMVRLNLQLKVIVLVMLRKAAQSELLVLNTSFKNSLSLSGLFFVLGN